MLATSNAALRFAVSKARTPAEFASRVGLSRQRLSYILKMDNLLPAEFVLAVEAAFGVSSHGLRPDIYPLTEVPAERTVWTGASIVPCDRRAGLQPDERV